MQSFAVVTHVLLACLCCDLPGLRQLFQSSEWGLIRKVMFARSHDLRSKRSSLRRNGSCRDQLNLRLLEDLLKRPGKPSLSKRFPEGLHLEWSRLAHPV